MTMGGYDRWQMAMGNMASKAIAAAAPMDDPVWRNKAGGALIAKMFGREPEEELEPVPQTPLAKFQMKLFAGHLEIAACHRAMHDIEIYIGSFPFNERKIRRSTYLRYHFENFLHEAYMLQLRLDIHFTTIKRAYRKDPRHPEIVARLEKLRAGVHKSLGGIVTTRGAHVHQARFSHKDFERLETLEFFEGHPVTPESVPVMRLHYLRSFRELRASWRKVVSENNSAVTQLLDYVGNGIVETIFAEPKDSLAPPTSLT